MIEHHPSSSDDAYFTVMRDYAPLMHSLGLLAAADVLNDKRLVVWRDLPDRDNSTLDATLPSGQAIRLHVKRDKKRRRESVALEATGILQLHRVGIASAPLVASGKLPDGKGFLITEELYGHVSVDRLIERGSPFRMFSEQTARIAATLHNAKLHHRDLYLNHFYSYDASMALIDAARVKAIPQWFSSRWIIKDVAQFLFSLGQADVSVQEQNAWIQCYALLAKRPSTGSFWRRVSTKAAWIARHDQALQAKSPTRNVRLPGGN